MAAPGFRKHFTNQFSLLLICALPFLQACGLLYPNRILYTEMDYPYQSFLDTVAQDFTLRQGDKFEAYIYPQGGYNLIESQITITSNGFLPQGVTSSLEYTIDVNGEANMPRLGWVKLAGMTEREAEAYLTTEYARFYSDPYVNVHFTNKFITVYRGNSDAKQLIISRPDITLLEAIGYAGGIPEDGRSSKVKIMRTINGQTQTEFLDLAGIKDLEKAQSYVRPNDIIYIEPGINSQFFNEVAPIITTVSSLVVIYAFFANLNKQ